MKSTSILGFVLTLAFAVTAFGYDNQKSPMQCAAGYREYARCAALKVNSMPEPKTTLSESLAFASLALYQDILTCRRNGSFYVQMNVMNGTTPDISPKLYAQLTSVGPTTRVIFDTDDHSSSSILFGNFSSSRENGNGQLIVDYRTNRTSGKKIDRFVYAVKCDYQR